MKRLLLMLNVVLVLAAFGDWTSDDRSMLRDIRNNQYDELSYWYEYRNGYTSQSPAGYAMGWRDFYKSSYLSQRELAEAKEYKFRVVDGNETIHLVEKNPFSDGNKTMFAQDNLAQENKPYYEDYIFSFFPQDYSHTWNNAIPDSSFLSAAASGDMMNKIVPEMNSNNLGISSIANSEQTSELRGQIQLAEGSLDSMFNGSDYSASKIDWDLSSLGQIFVDRHIMNTNPLINLKGSFRIVPLPTDFHYQIWYNYFRDGSTYGTLIRTCSTAMIFFLVLVYVVNDIMSIVDA